MLTPPFSRTPSACQASAGPSRTTVLAGLSCFLGQPDHVLGLSLGHPEESSHGPDYLPLGGAERSVGKPDPNDVRQEPLSGVHLKLQSECPEGRLEITGNVLPLTGALPLADARPLANVRQLTHARRLPHARQLAGARGLASARRRASTPRRGLAIHVRCQARPAVVA